MMPVETVCERVVGCDQGVRYLDARMATRLFVFDI